MAAGDWVAVRVSRDTRAKLEDLRARFEAYADGSPRPLGSDYTRSHGLSKNDRIGLDQVVRRLIDLYERHQGRKRKSAGKRLQRKDGAQ